MGDPVTPITGGCGCGGVRWELSAPPLGITYCHCTRCRRRTGTGHSVNMPIVRGSLTITEGDDLLREWLPEGGWGKVFCGACGSALFTRDPEDGRMASVRAGSFDRDPGVSPLHHQWVASAPPWDPVPDDRLTRYEGSSPR